MLTGGIKYFCIVSNWLKSPADPLFLAHYLICINIFMCFQVLLLLYSFLTQCSHLIGCCNVFNGTKIFFDSMDTVSCWVDQLSQWESCAGSSLSDSAPGLRSSPPSLTASTRWLSGGVQNNNKAVVGLSVVPRTCQHSWVILQPQRERGKGASGPQSLSDKVSMYPQPTLSYYTITK